MDERQNILPLSGVELLMSFLQPVTQSLCRPSYPRSKYVQNALARFECTHARVISLIKGIMKEKVKNRLKGRERREGTKRKRRGKVLLIED